MTRAVSIPVRKDCVQDTETVVVLSDDVQLKSSVKNKVIYGNLTWNDVHTRGTSARFMPDDVIKALILKAAAGLNITPDACPSDAQVVKFLEAARVPQQHGEELFRILAEKVIRWFVRNINPKAFSTALQYSAANHMQWTTNSKGWNTDTTLAHIKAQSFDKPLQAPPPLRRSEQAMLKGAIQILSSTGKWDVPPESVLAKPDSYTSQVNSPDKSKPGHSHAKDLSGTTIEGQTTSQASPTQDGALKKKEATSQVNKLGHSHAKDLNSTTIEGQTTSQASPTQDEAPTKKEATSQVNSSDKSKTGHPHAEDLNDSTTKSQASPGKTQEIVQDLNAEQLSYVLFRTIEEMYDFCKKETVQAAIKKMDPKRAQAITKMIGGLTGPSKEEDSDGFA